jgi:hypothetical protein
MLTTLPAAVHVQHLPEGGGNAVLHPSCAIRDLNAKRTVRLLNA